MRAIFLFGFAAIGAGVAIADSRARAEGAPGSSWSAWSASPAFLDETGLTATERSTLTRCGVGEAGLRETAHAVVERKLRDLPIPDLDEIALMQRAAGEPHPWARAWVVSGRTLDAGVTMAKLDAWLGLAPKSSSRRCGVASATAPTGMHALAVVAVDAVADLAPLPTRARPGEWLTVEARFLARATSVQVLILGPSGVPRLLPTMFDGTKVRARFAPERPGAFAVQIMADVGGGTRPVLEAAVFAGVVPQAQADRMAPGEEIGDVSFDDAGVLAHMVTTARGSVGLAPLARDVTLDAVASEHASRMARAGQLAHDLEDGDPAERMRAAGIDTNCVGENVAHASTVALAHRSLWASPSHRANLLRREFARIGVAVVRDGVGDAWVAEAFASR